jgi:hypothetical protein
VGARVSAVVPVARYRMAVTVVLITFPVPSGPPGLRHDGDGRRDADLAVVPSNQRSHEWDRQPAVRDTKAAEGHTVDLPYKQEVRTTFAEPAASETALEAVTAAKPAHANRR